MRTRLLFGAAALSSRFQARLQKPTTLTRARCSYARRRRLARNPSLRRAGDNRAGGSELGIRPVCPEAAISAAMSQANANSLQSK